MSLITKLKMLLSKMYIYFRHSLRLLAILKYDFVRYGFSGGIFHTNKDVLKYKILAHFHVIQKGLSFSNIKDNYGQAVIKNLLKLLGTYKKLAKFDQAVFDGAVATLNEYVKLQSSRGNDTTWLANALHDLSELDTVCGTKKLPKSAVHLDEKSHFVDVLENRVSLRTFSGEKIAEKDLKKAISLAQLAPSSCNRQSVHVFVVSDKKDKELVESLHNGVRGFSDSVDRYLLVAFDADAYTTPNERNLGYTDAGIFSMSLLLALTSQNIASCALNWSVAPKVDRALRAGLKLPDSSFVTLLIAIGGYPKDFLVAKSQRVEPESILKFL